MCSNKANIQELLETLTISSDIEVLSKLFSVLAAYLVTKRTKIEYIVRCKPLYEKVNEMLSQGSPYMKQTILNFLTALFSLDSEDDENRRSLVLHAQNLARVSGCLIAMCHLFTGCIMYQDTWIALVHCLSEACRGYEVNQSYCAHLVPICITKCDQENIEVCLLLESLLCNHERNIQLFLKSNGIHIFRRETLQFESCMLLLNSLVQKSTEAIAQLRESPVIYVLRDFLRTHGLQSRVGQWCKIILFYMEESNEVAEITKRATGTVEQKLPNIRNNVSQEFEDTANLFQNVIREVINWKTYSNEGKFKPPFLFNKRHFNPNYVESPQNLPTQKSFQNITYVKSYTGKDLSFSFLNKLEIDSNKNKDYPSFVSPVGSVIHRTNTLKYSCSSERYYSVSCQTDPSLFNTFENKVESDIAEFKPAFASTPIYHEENTLIQQTDENSCKIRDFKKKKLQRKISKAYKQRKRNDSRIEIKNQSLSSRFFSAINESCTSLVKSVKNIFKSKEKEYSDVEEKNVEGDENQNACNYSFTNYMRKRDALLSKQSNPRNTNFDDFSVDINKVDSCKTCNDTTVLKQKLAEDEYLKQTMKKLKLGINLYGCDFKKISKAMWPRDAYMTPNVLYTLYRKLIVK